MPKKKKSDKPDLMEVVKSLMTLSEASDWITAHLEEYKLTKPINTDTLKKACLQGRLKAAQKGKIYLTREQELQDYLKKFDPKNKTERQPLQERAKKRREAKSSQANTTESNQPEEVTSTVG